MIQTISAQPTDPDFIRILNERFRFVSTALEALQQGTSSTTTVSTATGSAGTHSARLAIVPTLTTLGSLFYETDRTTLYAVVNSGARVYWQPVAGIHNCALSARPTDLTANDEGFLIYTDYLHVHRWTGTAWEWGPGNDTPSGVIMMAAVSPGLGWLLCDGSGGTRSNANGSTTAITTPDMTGAYPKGAGSYSGSVDPAVAPGISGTVDDASAGTPTGTVSLSTSALYTLGAGLAVSSATFTGAPMADHTHTLTGLTTDDTGEPAHVGLMFFYRL